MSDKCPNCDKKCKGLMSQNRKLKQEFVDRINNISLKPKDSFCSNSDCIISVAIWGDNGVFLNQPTS